MGLLNQLDLRSRIWVSFIIVVLSFIVGVLLVPKISLLAVQIISYVLLIGLVVSVIKGLHESITTFFSEINRFTQELAAGNLEAEELAIADSGSAGEVKENLNQMQIELKSMVEELVTDLDKLETYSKELSASAEEGNATIEDTAQLIETILASIQKVSASTQEVTSLAQESSSKTQAGQEKIDTTLSIMDQIHKSVTNAVEIIHDLEKNSQEIGQIIGMIEDIAEQTNMLALNAAIEAARSGSRGSDLEGEQTSKNGSGFAVVAEEIRTLAEDTNQATEKVTSLINETQTKAEEGLEAIEEVKDHVIKEEEVIEATGDLFTGISQASQETAKQIETTSRAAQDLAENSKEVESATADIDKMSTEIADSSQELMEVVEDLHQLLQQFNFGEGDIDSLIWKERFSIGVDKIDEQHQQLFEQVNKLISMTQQNKSLTKIKEVLDFLAEYTINHFETEEKIQQQYDYPDYEKHKKIHEDFVAQVKEAKSKVEAGEMGSADLVKLNKIVSRWLVNHVKGIDQELGAHIAEQK